jgi:hypothetical protein
MIVAIMQPYFFPYIGYFQLIAQVQRFIFHDDVQYIKEGWVNRNRILRNGKPVWITVPVRNASHSLAIDQRTYLLTAISIGRILRRIENCYRKAPRFAEIFAMLHELMNFGDPNVGAFNINLIRHVSRSLGIVTEFLQSSELRAAKALGGQPRVLDLCTKACATSYLNPISGSGLYDAKVFAAAGIELRFLKPQSQPYAQFDAPPVPALSIIDVLMFNSNQTIATMLQQCQLVSQRTLESDSTRRH